MMERLVLLFALFPLWHALPTGAAARRAIGSERVLKDILQEGKTDVQMLKPALDVELGHKEGSQSKRLQALVRSLEVVLDKSGYQDTDLQKSAGCSCIGYNCGCCVKVERWNVQACVNITYLPAPQYGVSVTLAFDGKVILNETVSAKDPPPLCEGVPYLEKLASVCLRFYNLTYQDKSLSGCLQIEARLEGVMIKAYDLGCFQIPPKTGKGDSYNTALQKEVILRI